MRKTIILLMAFMLLACCKHTVSLNQGPGTSDVSEKNDVDTDASIPVTGQGMATAN